jgi:trigger factor
MVGQIAKDNQLSANSMQIDEKLNEMAQQYEENAQQMIDYYKADPQRLQSVEQVVIEKMVEDLINSQASVSVIEKTFNEVAR